MSVLYDLPGPRARRRNLIISIVTGAACNTLRRAHDAGIDLDAITAQLEREGVRSFCESYEQLLGRIEAKAEGKDRGRSDANDMRADRVGGRRN